MSVAASEHPACGVCGLIAEVVFSGHPGYRVGSRFDIHLCRACNTSQAVPREVDPAIYDEIYRLADELPGYERYVRYQRGVKLAPEAPLEFLATQEDVYWAVREQLLSSGGPRGGLRVLEAGSGLGYLTYALHESGYQAMGIDVSVAAVERASAAFGDLFEHAEIGEFAARHEACFDVVIMTELIEHLPNFKPVLVSALRALKPHGVVVITTPNRSSFAPDAIWATENPPVHLWWFSEDSMQALARELGCDVHFIDFTGFNRVRRGPGGFIEGRRQRTIPFYPPALAENGGPMPTGSTIGSQRPRLRRALDTFKVSSAVLEIRYRAHAVRRGLSHRRPNMCAVFTLTDEQEVPALNLREAEADSPEPAHAPNDRA